MSKATRGIRLEDSNIIKAPAYPFSGRQLFDDLQALLASENSKPLSFEELGQILGQSRSTAYFWSKLSDHPHLKNYICLLERLSPQRQIEYLQTHTRQLATLNHPAIAHSEAAIHKLSSLLDLDRGLTLIQGSNPKARALIFSALAREAQCRFKSLNFPAGIDVRVPVDFVPVEALCYLDPKLERKEVRKTVEKLWPRLATMKSPLLFLHGVWSLLPELREDVLRLTEFKQVFIADDWMEDPPQLRSAPPVEVRLVQIFDSSQDRLRIEVSKIR